MPLPILPNPKLAFTKRNQSKFLAIHDAQKPWNIDKKCEFLQISSTDRIVWQSEFGFGSTTDWSLSSKSCENYGTPDTRRIDNQYDRSIFQFSWSHIFYRRRISCVIHKGFNYYKLVINHKSQSKVSLWFPSLRNSHWKNSQPLIYQNKLWHHS